MQLIIDSNINRLVQDMTAAEERGMRVTTYWVTRLTKYAAEKMKYHVPHKTNRSTGKLKESIDAEVSIKGYSAEGIAYVPSTMGIYQYVVEGGRKARGRRQRGIFAFPVEHWKKGMRNPNILKLAQDGKFIFIALYKGIKLGDYKGSHFVQKSFADLLRVYEANRMKIESNFQGSLFFSTSLG